MILLIGGQDTSGMPHDSGSLPSLARLGSAQDTEHQHALTTRRLDADFVSLPFHFHVPHGVLLHEAAAVAVDSRNRVYCFNRGNIPLLVETMSSGSLALG